MPINNCRVCGSTFFEKPLLSYKNMPKAAQFMPDAASLDTERGVDLEVYQCSGCGLIQLNNEPVDYYREVVRASAFSEEMKNFRMKQFGDFITNYALSGKKILEIGCGRGEYLSLMNSFDIKAFGLEYSEESVKYCINNGLDVAKGYIQGSSEILTNAPFDAFFILSFLEHMPDPNSALKGIYNNLNDCAIGLVEVPNFNMIIQKKLFSEFIGDHLFYFTKETLKTTLAINGFEILEITPIWYNYILSAIVRKRNKTDISDFQRHKKQLQDDVENYVNRFENKRIAVWGAGHQSLAVISLLNLSHKIKYVVDSAPFKQGKYTPATHIPIVSPDMLNSDPVDAVIVIAGSYSDEVVKIIKQKFTSIKQVTILRDFGLEHH